MCCSGASTIKQSLSWEIFSKRLSGVPVKNCILRATRALIDPKDASASYGARSLDFAQFPAALPDCKSKTTIRARRERNILLFTVSQSYESLTVDVLYYFPQENFDWRRFWHSHSIEIWLQKEIGFSLGMHNNLILFLMAPNAFRSDLKGTSSCIDRP